MDRKKRSVMHFQSYVCACACVRVCECVGVGVGVLEVRKDPVKKKKSHSQLPGEAYVQGTLGNR